MLARARVTGRRKSHDLMPCGAPLDAAVDRAFDNTPVHRLWLDVLVENPRAKRVYECHGFTQEDVFRQSFVLPGGGRTDCAVLSPGAGSERAALDVGDGKPARDLLFAVVEGQGDDFALVFAAVGQGYRDLPADPVVGFLEADKGNAAVQIG